MIQRGDIYYISRDYTEEGHEERGGRPGLVISTNALNNEGYGAIVLYMTSNPQTNSPYHCEITSFNGRSSVVLCETVRYVAASRIGNFAGRISYEDMQKVEYCLQLAEGLEPVDTVEELYEEGELTDEDELTQDGLDLKTENLILSRELTIYKELYYQLIGQLTEARK